MDKNNTLVCEHTRLEAAKTLKLKTIPVFRLEKLSEEQRAGGKCRRVVAVLRLEKLS